MTSSDSSRSRHLAIVQALLLVALLAGWSACLDVIHGSVEFASASRADPLRIVLILLDAFVTCGVVAWLGCVVWAKQSFTLLGWRMANPVRLILLGILLTALLFASLFGFVALMGGMEFVRSFAGAVAHMPASERVYFTIMGAKVAFVEETLFRGLLLQTLARKTGTLLGVLLSGVVFALYHRSLSPVPFLIMKMVLGVYFAVFTIVSRSLVPAWLGHWWLWAIAGDN